MAFVNAQAFINSLIEAQTGITCGTRIPITLPARFIRTIRTGGNSPTPVTDVARLTFECWNASKVGAERDAQEVRALVLRLAGRSVNGVKIHRVTEIAAPSDSPDLDTDTPRFVLTLEVAFRGTI